MYGVVGSSSKFELCRMGFSPFCERTPSRTFSGLSSFRVPFRLRKIIKFSFLKREKSNNTAHFTSFTASSLGRATSVSVVTHSEISIAIFIASFSFAASNTTTASQRPSVQYQFSMLIPFFFHSAIILSVSPILSFQGFFEFSQTYENQANHLPKSRRNIL